MMDELSKMKIRKVENYTSAGTDAIDSAIIDMAGFNAVIFLTTLAVANAGNYLKIQQDTDSAGGTMADLAGSKCVATANNEVVGVKILNPAERYLRAYVVRGASTAVGEIYAIQYNAKYGPQDNDVADTISLVELLAPAEGTA